MSVRNYTSSTPVSHSLARIMQRLVDHGASDVVSNYVEKKITGLAFVIPSKDGQRIPIRLPARAKQIAIVLRRQLKRPTQDSLNRIDEQAERTAWKLMDEWVEIQLTLVRLEQIEMMEAFLPFVWNPTLGTTFYQRVKEGGMLALTEAIS